MDKKISQLKSEYEELKYEYEAIKYYVNFLENKDKLNEVFIVGELVSINKENNWEDKFILKDTDKEIPIFNLSFKDKCKLYLKDFIKLRCKVYCDNTEIKYIIFKEEVELNDKYNTK